MVIAQKQRFKVLSSMTEPMMGQVSTHKVVNSTKYAQENLSTKISVSFYNDCLLSFSTAWFQIWLKHVRKLLVTLGFCGGFPRQKYLHDTLEEGLKVGINHLSNHMDCLNGFFSVDKIVGSKESSWQLQEFCNDFGYLFLKIENSSISPSDQISVAIQII